MNELIEKAKELELEAMALREEANKLISQEKNAPAWLKSLIITIADSLGITAEEFSERIEIIHPTPADPVILVDKKPVVAWI